MNIFFFFVKFKMVRRFSLVVVEITSLRKAELLRWSYVDEVTARDRGKGVRTGLWKLNSDSRNLCCGSLVNEMWWWN